MLREIDGEARGSWFEVLNRHGTRFVEAQLECSANTRSIKATENATRARASLRRSQRGFRLGPSKAFVDRIERDVRTRRFRTGVGKDVRLPNACDDRVRRSRFRRCPCKPFRVDVANPRSSRSVETEAVRWSSDEGTDTSIEPWIGIDRDRTRIRP